MSYFHTLRPGFLGLFALLGTAAHAQQPAAVQVTQPDAVSLRLRLDNPTQQPARLQVIHLNNDNVVLNETHREAAYGTRLMFDTLPSGRYAVVLRLGRDDYRYTVQVQARPTGSTISVRDLTTHRLDNVLASADTH